MKRPISRRSFAKESALASLVLMLNPRASVGSVTEEFDLTTSAPDIHEAIFAETSVGDFLTTSREKELRELLVLGHIYKRANSALDDPTIATATLNELRSIAVDGSAVSPKTFDDFSFLLTAATSESRARDQELLRQGLQLSSGVVGIFSGVAGGALTVAGSLAETRLGLTTGNEPLLPGVEQEQLRNIAKVALAKGLQMHRREAAFRQTLSHPGVKALVGVDFGATTSQLVEKLPPDQKEALKGILSKNLAGLRVQNSENRELIRNLTEQVSKQAEKLQSHAEGATKLIGEIRDQQTREEERRARQAKMAYINGEISGALVIADVVLVHLFGNSRAANVLKTTVTTLQSVYNATAQFCDNGIGTLALTGAYLNGAIAIAALFSSGGPSPEQQILMGIGKLHQHLEAIRLELDKRLDVIERRQLVTLNYLSTLLTEMRANHAEVSARLETIKQTLNLQYEASMTTDAQRIRNNLKEHINQSRNNLADRGTRRFSLVGFKNNLAHFSTYATDFSSETPFAGNYEPPLSSSLLIIEKNARRQAPFMFGLLPKICATLGFHVGADPLPNPVEWARGSEAYIEVRFSAPEYNVSEQEDQLNAMWGMGLRLKQIVKIVTGEAALRKVAEQYMVLSHNEKPDSFDVVKHLRLIFKKLSDEKKFHPKPFEQSPEISGRPPFNGSTYYKGKRSNEPVFVLKIEKDDPIDRALEMDLIELRRVNRPPLTLLGAHIGLESNQDVYELVIKAGEKNGQKFGGIVNGLLVGFVNETVTQSGGRATMISWNTDERFFIKDILELKEFCRSLVEEATNQYIQREIPQRIRNDSTDMSTFESVGVIAQLFGAIARWRRSSANYSIHDVSLNSVNLIATKNDLADLVNDKIAKTKPKYFSGWEQVEEEIISALKSQADIIRGIGNGIAPGKSIPVVDETLSRLMAYMEISGIPFSTPGRTSPINPEPVNDLTVVAIS